MSEAGLEQKLEIYLSHSWHARDVALNLAVWEQLGAHCLLSVDRQGAVLRKGAFYVNRLEYLIRQSEAFVCVLPYRPRAAQPSGDSRTAAPDTEQESESSLRCSKASLFELRLAERARKPRLIIYDSRTRFRPTSPASEVVKYEAIRSAYELDRGAPTIRTAVDAWLTSLARRRSSGLFPVRNDVSILLDETSADAPSVRRAILDGLSDSRFSKRHYILPHHLDSDIVSMLQSSDLFIAEVGSLDSGALGIAHALFVPTIRIMASGQAVLPTLLTGHAFGYDQDIVVGSDLGALPGAIRERVDAMDENRRLVSDLESGRAYLRSKLGGANKIFISHNLSGSDAKLVQEIVNRLSEHSITAWEYRDRMTAGVEWREKLQLAMADSTHVVFLAATGFESSRACHHELVYFQQTDRFNQQNIFPFLWNRDTPIAAFVDVDNPRLPSGHAEASQVVVDRLVAALHGSSG